MSAVPRKSSSRKARGSKRHAGVALASPAKRQKRASFQLDSLQLVWRADGDVPTIPESPKKPEPRRRPPAAAAAAAAGAGADADEHNTAYIDKLAALVAQVGATVVAARAIDCKAEADRVEPVTSPVMSPVTFGPRTVSAFELWKETTIDRIPNDVHVSTSCAIGDRVEAFGPCHVIDAIELILTDWNVNKGWVITYDNKAHVLPALKELQFSCTDVDCTHMSAALKDICDTKQLAPSVGCWTLPEAFDHVRTSGRYPALHNTSDEQLLAMFRTDILHAIAACGIYIVVAP
jgi:hypothetical protein